MPYYDVANLAAVIKTNIIDEMPCGYGTQRTATEILRLQVSRGAAQTYAVVSAALEVSCRPAQGPRLVRNLSIV